MSAKTFLRRIILIHTAGISYLEIPLEQHLHLDDPGRELPLRELILFFYHPQDEVPAAWLPSPDLRVIYEVSSGGGMYLLMLKAEGSRARMRLIRSGYDREWWTDAQGTVLAEEKTLSLCKRLKLEYSEPLSAGAYADIASGKAEGKFARYALFPATPSHARALMAEGRFFESHNSGTWAARLYELGMGTAFSLPELRDRVEGTSHTWEALSVLRRQPARLSEIQALSKRLTRAREQGARAQQQILASIDAARLRLGELLGQLAQADSSPEALALQIRQLREAQIRLQAARPEPERLWQFELQTREALLREPGLQRQIQDIREKISRLEAEKERSLAQLRQLSEARQETLRQEIEGLQQHVKSRDNVKPLYAWLEERYPDWQETLGKVLRDEVLQHPYLNPQIDRINDLIFGLRLDLSDIPVPQKQYEVQPPDKKQRENLLAQRQKDLIAAREEGEKEISACEKKFRAKIQEENRHLVQAQHGLDQCRLLARRYESERSAYIRYVRQQAESESLRIGYQLQLLEQTPESPADKRKPARKADAHQSALLALQSEAQVLAEAIAEAESMCQGAVAADPALPATKSFVDQLLDYKEIMREEQDLLSCIQARAASLALLLPPEDPLSRAVTTGEWELWSEEALRSREEEAGEQLGSLIREISAMASVLETGEEIETLCRKVNEELAQWGSRCRVQLQLSNARLIQLLLEIRRFQQNFGEQLSGPTLFHPEGAAEVQRKALEWVSALAEELDLCTLPLLGNGDLFDWEITPESPSDRWLCSAAFLAIWLKEKAASCRFHLLLPEREQVYFSQKINAGEEEARIFISTNLPSDTAINFQYYQKSKSQEKLRSLVW